MSEPTLKEVQHRYLIETASGEYWCDEFILYNPGPIEAYRIEHDFCDMFSIYDTALAIHDFMPEMSFDDFKKYKESKIKESKEDLARFQEQQIKALKQPVSDVGCQ